jgi:hypothetical protein
VADEEAVSLASDFDQTLSFNDSGLILSELLGTSGFREKVAALAHLNLVQQGAELAYLLRHDPSTAGGRPIWSKSARASRTCRHDDAGEGIAAIVRFRVISAPEVAAAARWHVPPITSGHAVGDGERGDRVSQRVPRAWRRWRSDACSSRCRGTRWCMSGMASRTSR